ncbi:MAG: Holliday junction resolvase RuvX [Gemmatimonadaceae bacterium]
MNTALARFIAVDYGEKRVGLAIADTIGMIATPAGFIARRAGKRAPIAEIIRRAEAMEARGFVVGLPLDGGGNETEWTAEVRRVGDELGKRTSLPVKYLDERFTTATSLRAIREMDGSTRGRKGDVDAMAAAVLLQNALNVTE